MTQPNMHEAACYYARQWPVFPITHGGKEPLTAHGYKDATTDAAQLAAWWESWPAANIGLDCGGAGLLVLDFDTAKPEYGGHDLLLTLWNEYPTLAAQTGSGGYHLLYRQPEGAQLRNSRGGLPAGVDVRGHGGYIVLAPSLHPSGNRYRWVKGYGPHERTPAALPDIVLDLLAGQTRPAAQTQSAAGERADAGRVGRAMDALHNRRAADYFDWLAVGMALHSWDSGRGLALWESFSRRCPEKYHEGECAKVWRHFKAGGGRTIASVFAWADEDAPGWWKTGTPAGVPAAAMMRAADAGDSNEGSAPEDEPDELPNPLSGAGAADDLRLGWIDDYARLMTGLTGAPFEFNRLAGLVTAATAIQRRAWLPMAFGDIFPNVYAAIVARSSVYHKSSALSKPRALLKRAMLDRLLLSELATSEGLLKQLAGQSCGVVIRDEIGTLFASHNTKYLATLKPDLTALYDCYPYSRRLSNDAVKVDAPYLNILGATTPTRFYEGVSFTDWQDGFLARWLFVMPEGEPDFDAMTGLYTPQHDAALGALAATLVNLDRQPETPFTLAGDAHKRWDAWQRQAAKDAYLYGDDVIAAIVTRYAAYALKFAMILSAVNGSWGTVTPDTMQTAITLADSYKAQMGKLLAERTNYGISGAKLQKVFAVIKRKGGGDGVTRKTVQQFAHLRANEVAACLDKLLDIGAIIENNRRYFAVADQLPVKMWK